MKEKRELFVEPFINAPSPFWRGLWIVGFTFALMHTLGWWGAGIAVCIVGYVHQVHREILVLHRDHLAWHIADLEGKLEIYRNTLGKEEKK